MFLQNTRRLMTWWALTRVFNDVIRHFCSSGFLPFLTKNGSRWFDRCADIIPSQLRPCTRSQDNTSFSLLLLQALHRLVLTQTSQRAMLRLGSLGLQCSHLQLHLAVSSLRGPTVLYLLCVFQLGDCDHLDGSTHNKKFLEALVADTLKLLLRC